jgi:hypothetical protein
MLNPEKRTLGMHHQQVAVPSVSYVNCTFNIHFPEEHVSTNYG